jgi:hypothetical protein
MFSIINTPPNFLWYSRPYLSEEGGRIAC